MQQLAKAADEIKHARGLDDLLITKSWSGTLGLTLFGVVVSFFLFGYWNAYWRFADMDYMMVYQGFLLNDGKPQDFFDHPGHLQVVLTDAWFRLLHWLGALDVIALSQIPDASDAAGFERVWTAAIRAGRLLSLLLALSFVGAFAALMRRLIADWRVAVLATALLAFSTGVIWQSIQMRTDLLAAGLSTIGLLVLLLAARSPASSWRPLLVGIAALLCTLGVVNRVQAIFMVGLWPIVVLFFGLTSEGSATLWRPGVRALWPIVILAALGWLAAATVVPLFEVAFSARSSSVFPFPPPPFGVLGLYQLLLAAYVAAAILAFAWMWRVAVLETIATLLAVMLGVEIGLSSILLHYHPQNALSVINFLEHMFVWAGFSDPQLANSGGVLSFRLVQSLAWGLYEQFAHFTFVLHTSSRATVFLQWVTIAGMVLAWRSGQRLLVVQTAVLLAAAWGIDIMGTLRGAKIAYAIFGDPVVIIAAAWLFGNLPALAGHRWAYPIGAALLTTQIVFGQFEAVKAAFTLRRTPDSTCEWLPRHIKLIPRFPYCPPKAQARSDGAGPQASSVSRVRAGRPEIASGLALAAGCTVPCAAHRPPVDEHVVGAAHDHAAVRAVAEPRGRPAVDDDVA